MVLAAILPLGLGAEPQIKVAISHGGPVNWIDFSPDGSLVVTASSDSTLRLWEAETGRELKRFSGHEGFVSQVAFPAGGKALVSLSERDRSIRFWDIATGVSYKKLDFSELTYSPLFGLSPDGSTLAYATREDKYDKYTYLLDTSTFRLRSRLKTSETMDKNVISPDGKSLVFVHGTGNDSTVRLWDIAKGKETRSLGKVWRGGRLLPRPLPRRADCLHRLWQRQLQALESRHRQGPAKRLPRPG